MFLYRLSTRVSVRLCMVLFVMDFPENVVTGASWDKDDLIRFCGQTVKGLDAVCRVLTILLLLLLLMMMIIDHVLSASREFIFLWVFCYCLKCRLGNTPDLAVFTLNIIFS